MQSFEIGGERIVLVATAAENGVLAISEREHTFLFAIKLHFTDSRELRQ